MLKTHSLTLQIIDQLLFSNITVSLDSKSRKKVALVGVNGAGKSSLLKVFIGELNPTSGSVSIADETIGYLPQEITIEGAMLVGEYLESKLRETWMEYKIDTVLAAVGLDQNVLIKEFGMLSGGEKVKIYLAGLLLDEPTILLLDEPTNNLDINGVEWLVQFIRDFSGSVLVVTHDRYIINECINQIWEINPDRKGIDVYHGNYEDFVREKKSALEKQETTYRREQRAIKKTEQWLKEHEFHPKYRFSIIVGVQKQKLSRLKREESSKPTLRRDINLQDVQGTKRGLVIKGIDLTKQFGSHKVLNSVSLAVRKDERVLISGPNGSGKTTLLNILAGHDAQYQGQLIVTDGVTIGYLKQFSDLDENESILRAFELATRIIEPASRSILMRYLFDQNMVLSKVGTLSFGQRKRLDLAIILAQQPDLLILDEPTNHLDIYTREELESFILKQPIPMIIVSHDRYFLEKLNITDVITL